MINRFKRYQPGLTLATLYPALEGECACGCGEVLANKRRKWYSDQCREAAYINFAIVKGDTSVIRQQLYSLDEGACRCCGQITDDWEADHIMSVFEGGGACSLSNLQTLCKDCHQEKSQIVSHQRAISSQAASILRIRSLKPAGEHSMVCWKTSKEMLSF